jgi:hypothetical protein
MRLQCWGGNSGSYLLTSQQWEGFSLSCCRPGSCWFMVCSAKPAGSEQSQLHMKVDASPARRAQPVLVILHMLLIGSKGCLLFVASWLWLHI